MGRTKPCFLFALFVLVTVGCIGCANRAEADVPLFTLAVLPTLRAEPTRLSSTRLSSSQAAEASSQALRQRPEQSGGQDEAASATPTRPQAPIPARTPTPVPSPTPLPTLQGPHVGLLVTPQGGSYSPTELALREHYWLDWPAPGRILSTYPYGGRWPGGTWVHRGVDISANTGDTVVAVAPGVVTEAGDNLVDISGHLSDAYGIHVFMQLDQTFDGWPIYILYAHFSQVLVREGDHVEGGQLIGLAGATGFTTGPHIHLEVRIGENDPLHTRNAELWLKPRNGSGTLAGRLVDPAGEYIHERTIGLYDREKLIRHTRTYASSVVNPDEGWGENFVFWEVPPGRYTVRADLGTETHVGSAEIVAGRTTLVTFTTLGLPATITPSPTATKDE